MPTQKIRTVLWYDTQAEEAARFYCSLFRDSKIGRVAPGPAGTPVVVEFELAGTQFIALNGGPHFRFNEAISLFVECADQAEVDELWEKLSAGGSTSQCGWLKDRYGVSWQIIPTVLLKLMSDPQRGAAVTQAMLKMTKIDIQQLEDAYASAHA